MIEEKLVDFILQIAATGFGAFLGYLGGLKILKQELEAEKEQKRQELEADEEQKRNRVIESLLIEINTHTEPLNRLQEVLTFSFDGIIASGLYILLPPESQEIVSRHYQGCHQVNNYNNAGRTITQQQVTKIQYIKTRLLRDLKPVIKNLENLRS